MNASAARSLDQDFDQMRVTQDSYSQQRRQPTSHPFKNGLASFTPVIYPNPADSSSEEEDDAPPPPPPPNAGHAPSSSPYRTGQVVSSVAVGSYPHREGQQGFASSVPYYTGPLTRQQVPGSHNYANVGRIDQDSPYDEDGFLPPPVPSQVTYGAVSGSQTVRSVDSNYRQPTYQVPAHRSGTVAHSSPMTSRSTYVPQSASSRLVYTTSSPVQGGYAQSRPAHGDTSPGKGFPSRTQDSFVASGYESGGGGSTPQSPSKEPKEAEVDALTSLLVQNMEAAADPDFFGMCARCSKPVRGQFNGLAAMDKVYHLTCFSCCRCGMCGGCEAAIYGEKTGCSALGKAYHMECFKCSACAMRLDGHPFFAVDAKPFCEACYMSTLEKCSVCAKAITDRVLRATGKPYHPGCFICVVCGKSLDGVPFTVDATNQIHCIEDFHSKFAPRCCVCSDPIMPSRGQEETVRIVALDRSFHVRCYKCEDCGVILSSESEGRGCYPLDDHILCKNCNARRIQAMTTKMTTEL